MYKNIFVLFLIVFTSCITRSNYHIDNDIYEQIMPSIIMDDFSCFAVLPDLPPGVRDTLLTSKNLEIFIYDSLVSECNINNLSDTVFNKKETIKLNVDCLENNKCNLKIYNEDLLDRGGDCIIITFSRIYLDKNKSNGVFTLNVYKDKDDSTKYIYYIKKRQNTWIVYDSRVIWKS